MKNIVYDHYIAVDWADKNMAIARMTKKTNKITAIDVPSDISDLQCYLKKLKGSKILAVEETTTAQWLYTELLEYVDEVLICDPYRNKLLNDGPKNDKIDAIKLVTLLKAGLMREVYHSGSNLLYLRRLVSGYDDLVKAGVRAKCQRYSLLKSCGSYNKSKGFRALGANDQYVLDCLNRQIKSYADEKKGYEKEFKRLSHKHPAIQHQTSLPGIGIIHAVKIVSRVVTPYRFPSKGHYLSYAGLMKLEKISGGRSYGKRNPRYSRQLKYVYKIGVQAAIRGNNPINDYYEYLIDEKKYPEFKARQKACRRLAVLSLGVLRSNKKFQINNGRNRQSIKQDK